MKKMRTNMGLYDWVTRLIPENGLEKYDVLSKYLFVANHSAKRILRDAHIDPKILWWEFEQDGERAPLIEFVKRDSRSPEVEHAIYVVDLVREIQMSGDLDKTATRDALWRGRRLAEEYERMTVNRWWLRPIKAGIKFFKKGAESQRALTEEKRSKVLTEWQPLCDAIHARNRKLSWHAIAERVAAEVNASTSTVKRWCEDPTRKKRAV